MPGRLYLNKLIFFCSLFLLSGCATIYNPATQRKEAIWIDTQSEISLGRNMDEEIRKKLKVSDDPVMNQRLNFIGSRISRVSDRQDVSYYFRVVKDKELNAFAIPGGFVYCNSGLMLTATDDELACVLAHEVGHISARHSVKKLEATMAYDLLRTIVVGVTGQQTIAQAVDLLVFNPATLAYSRKDELLADKLAVRYAKAAGFSPYGAVTFFEKLKKEQEKGGSSLRIEILSSHPDLDERIKKVREEIALNP